MIVRQQCHRDARNEQQLRRVIKTCQSEKNHTLINHNLITSIRSWLDLNIVSFACNKYLIMATLCSSDSNVTETPDMNNDFIVQSKHANQKKSHFDKSQSDNKHSFMVRLEYCKFCLQQIPHYGNTVFIKQVMSQRRLIWATTLSCGRNTPIWKKSKFCKSQFDNKHSFMVIDLNILSFACNKYLIMVTLCSSDSDVTETPDMNNDFVVWSKHANLSAHVISSR